MSLLTGINVGKLPSFQEAKGQQYMTNGWAPIKVWDGIRATIESAGISAPPSGFTANDVSKAAGSSTAGTHLVRYRYKDTRTGYVSDPSAEVSVTVATAGAEGELTFPIDDSAGDIYESSDNKCDKIVVEMTLAGGSIFYEATEVDNASGNAVVSIADASLEQKDLLYPDYGHEVPPKARFLLYHKGVMWAFGEGIHSTGTVTVASAGAKSAVFNTAANVVTQLKNLLIKFSGIASAFAVNTVTPTNRLAVMKKTIGAAISGKSYIAFPNVGRIGWPSQLDYPESFHRGDRYKEFLRKTDETDVMAAASCLGDIVVLGEHSGEVYRYTEDPLLGAHVPIPGGRGALNHRCAIVVDNNTLFAVDRQGPWMWRGGRAIDLSGEVIDDWDLIDQSTASLGSYSFMLYSAADRKVFFFIDGGSTQHATWDGLIYSIDDGTFDTIYFEGDRKLTCGCNCLDSNGRPRLLVYDDNGHSWFLNVGTTDGASTASTNGTAIHIITCDSSCTTTTIYVHDDCDDLPDDPEGSYLYWVEGEEARLITGHDYASAETLTVEAFGSAPSNGDTFYIGRIPVKIKSKLFRPRDPKEFADNPQLHVFIKKASSGKEAEVRFYEEGSSTAVNAGATYTEAPNVETTSGDSDHTIELDTPDEDLAGHIAVPLDLNWNKGIEVEFLVSKPRQEFVLRDFLLSGKQRPEMKEEK